MYRIWTFILVICLVLGSSLAFASDNKDLFGAGNTALFASAKDMQADFADFTKAISTDYTNFVEEHEKAYTAFKQEIEEKWGAFKDSTVTAWVAYSDDLNARSSVDFKEGFAHFETLLHEDSAQAKAEALHAIQEQMHFVNEECLEHAGFGLPTLSDKPSTALDSPFHHDSLQGYTSDLEAYRSLAEAHLIHILPNTLEAQSLTMPQVLPHVDMTPQDMQASPKYPQPSPQTPPQHQEKRPSRPRTHNQEKAPYTMTVQVPLPTDYLQKAANKYRSLVYENGSRFGVKTHVVYAIIHTESYFNPFARSHVPAYGLMQLVPKSGGKDAYEYVYKKSVKPSAQFLYDPSNNILLGTAYFSKVRDVYFKGIHDEESAYIVSIAAYNTGAGNVARALTGTKSLPKAIAKVNSMTPKQVYAVLLKYLPYDETKKYLENVLNRSAMYRGV